MAPNYLQLIIITSTTVGKIIAGAVAGMVASRYYSGGRASEKGLTYISVTIFLPCLLFSNLCLRLTWEALALFYWAPLLACIPVVLGLSAAVLVRRVLPDAYRGVLMLGCTFQNGLIFPLSLMLNLKGVDWLDEDAAQQCQAYVFLYNIVCSIGLWGIGEPMIAYYKKQELLEEERAAKEVVVMAMTATDPTSSSRLALSYPMKEGEYATVEEQCAWYKPSSPLGDQPIQLEAFVEEKQRRARSEMSGDGEPTTVVEPSPPSLFAKWMATANSAAPIVLRAIRSPPVMASLLAMIIALTPPLRWCAESFGGSTVIGGLGIIGAGGVPLQILVMGGTVAGPREADGGHAVEERQPNADVEDEEHPRSSSWLQRYAPSPQIQFTVVAIVVRLMAIPAICFLIIHLLRVNDVLPSDRPFILSILVSTCSPAAINASLICTMHSYHVKPFTQMIFVMYLTSIATTTLWLFVYVLYLS